MGKLKRKKKNNIADLAANLLLFGSKKFAAGSSLKYERFFQTGGNNQS